MVSQVVDLSAYGGKVIQVRFSFDTGDAALNDFEGWVVDDVAVTVTYAWDFGDGTTGTGVAPTHVYGAGGTFTVTLIVNDGAASSGPATTTVAVNQPPVANAGPDQTVKQRTTATLNGTASSDPAGSIVGYAWTQVSGTPVTLSGASSAVATFTAPDLVKSVPVARVFELAVTDDRGARAADQVAVTVSVK